MFWFIVLPVLALVIFVVLTYLMDSGKITDIPEGWHPPGDHTAEWINEDNGKPTFGPRDKDIG